MTKARIMLLVGAVVALSACTADRETPEPEKNEVAGLELSVNERNHVAGKYEKDGKELVFDFAKDGDTKTALLRRTNGHTMLESRLEDGVDTMKVMDGRAVVSGAPGSETPEKTGDASALEEMYRLPEMPLLPELRKALEQAGVARELWMGTEDPRAGGTHPQQWQGGDGWWHLGPGECRTFPTWSFWGRTTVEYANESSSKSGMFSMNGWGWYEYRMLPPSWSSYTYGYWAAIPITLCNLYVNWYGTIYGPVQLKFHVY